MPTRIHNHFADLLKSSNCEEFQFLQTKISILIFFGKILAKPNKAKLHHIETMTTIIKSQSFPTCGY